MRKKKWLKRLAAALVVLLILFVLASNIVVDLALVPEKMEQTQAFEDITEDSYEALVQTDDIEQNRMSSLEKTNRWAETADSEALSVTTADGYLLKGMAFYQESESHNWVLLLHGYTGWKEEMYPIAYEYARRGYQVLVPDIALDRQEGQSAVAADHTGKGRGCTDRHSRTVHGRRLCPDDDRGRTSELC